MKPSNNQLFATGMWIATIFFSVIPSLLIFVFKSDNAFLRKHAVQAFHFAAAVLLAMFVCWVLKIIYIGILLMYVVSFVDFVVCGYCAVMAFNGNNVKIIPDQFLLTR